MVMGILTIGETIVLGVLVAIAVILAVLVARSEKRDAIREAQITRELDRLEYNNKKHTEYMQELARKACKLDDNEPKPIRKATGYYSDQQAQRLVAV